MNHTNQIDILKSIDNDRMNMYELASKKGISDPEVIKLSQYLDKNILDIMIVRNKKCLELIN